MNYPENIFDKQVFAILLLKYEQHVFIHAFVINLAYFETEQNVRDIRGYSTL
jgi:hypothetical protein